MRRLEPRHSVRKMCRVLGVKEQIYYQWRHQEAKRIERRMKETELVGIIEKAFHGSGDVYGAGKLTRGLRDAGIQVSEWKVQRIMREHGFYSVSKIKQLPWRHHQEDGLCHDDLVQQDFHVAASNVVWVGDITYIKTKLGWVYLAVVIDLFNREIIGYAVSRRIDSELTKRALGEAIGKYPEVEGTIFHSDRGCQYTSVGYRHALELHGMRGSMSRPGCPYDNACAESFFAQLKKERIHHRNYRNMEEVESDLFDYIELFYNRKRIHSTLNYQTPIGFRFSNMAFNCAN